MKRKKKEPFVDFYKDLREKLRKEYEKKIFEKKNIYNKKDELNNITPKNYG